MFSAILTNAINSNTEDDAVDIEMQSDMMLILSGLCDADMHRKVGAKIDAGSIIPTWSTKRTLFFNNIYICKNNDNNNHKSVNFAK